MRAPCSSARPPPLWLRIRSGLRASSKCWATWQMPRWSLRTGIHVMCSRRTTTMPTCCGWRDGVEDMFGRWRVPLQDSPPSTSIFRRENRGAPSVRKGLGSSFGKCSKDALQISWFSCPNTIIRGRSWTRSGLISRLATEGSSTPQGGSRATTITIGLVTAQGELSKIPPLYQVSEIFGGLLRRVFCGLQCCLEPCAAFANRPNVSKVVYFC